MRISFFDLTTIGANTTVDACNDAAKIMHKNKRNELPPQVRTIQARHPWATLLISPRNLEKVTLFLPVSWLVVHSDIFTFPDCSSGTK
jgi:hypothetical protein